MKKNKKNKKTKFSVYFLIVIVLIIDNYIGTKIINNLISKGYSKFNLISNINKNKIKFETCNNLTKEIIRIIGDDKQNWSVSNIDVNGIENISINSQIPRIPASNQKLITTAFSLYKLPSNFKLKTILKKDIYGNYHLTGNGDPDFGKHHINKILKKIEYSNNFKTIFANNTSVNLNLYDEPYYYWWPDDWNKFDKEETYGAPVTRLGINSNSSSQSINYPIDSTINYLRRLSKNYDLNLNITKKDYNSFPKNFLTRTILIVNSAPLNSLLTLVNSESHNFTAEILLRNSLGNWNTLKNRSEIYQWLESINVPINEVYISDGSGLSRKNLLTSRSLAHLLYKMKLSKFKNDFISSMAIIGVRGTLTNFPSSYSLKGNFFGKSGTLTGVRTLSGYIRKNNTYSVVSILTRNIDNADSKIASVLNLIENNSCN